MTNKLLEHVPRIQLFLGLILYLYCLSFNAFAMAIICLVVTLYIWIFTSIYLQTFKYLKLINLLCYSGIIISISMVIIFGTEEVPYPEGAMIFHVNYIAGSILLFFISSLPLFITHKYYVLTLIDKLNRVTHDPVQNQQEAYDEEKWEMATIEDVNSGDFEAI